MHKQDIALILVDTASILLNTYFFISLYEINHATNDEYVGTLTFMMSVCFFEVVLRTIRLSGK